MASLNADDSQSGNNDSSQSSNPSDPNVASSSKSEEKDSSNEDGFFPLAFFKNHKFEAPTKRISIPSHINKFLTSPTYSKLIKFLNDLADAVKQEKIPTEYDASDTIQKCVAMLDELDQWVDEVEPLQIQGRYGNKAFRIWMERVRKGSAALVTPLLPESWTSSTESDSKENEENEKSSILKGMISELSGYLEGSFGDNTRIDYGTGHELTFICFLLILVELRALRRSDYKLIVLIVFNRYIILMRKIQSKYGLEPAGSKGVWGLDDYQYLPFYFGAAQLMEHDTIRPKDITDKTVLAEHKKDYLYLSSIDFILTMKTGPFAEHSPLLNDISAVPYWVKVKSGLLKMYQDDVLKKLPVIQHFLFGSVLTIDLPPVDHDAESQNEKAEILRRKQALIAKLNAKNPKFQSANKASTDNNNGNQGDTGNDPMVMTSAPWATPPSGNKGGADPMPSTKAPWAK